MTTECFVQVRFSDDATYLIPVAAIANHRAAYFANLDSVRGEGAYAELFARERAATLRDTGELLDWAANNMDWADVARAAILVATPPIDADYDREWTNAERVVVEREARDGVTFPTRGR